MATQTMTLTDAEIQQVVDLRVAQTDIKHLSWKQNIMLYATGACLVLILSGFVGTWMWADDRFGQMDAKIDRLEVKIDDLEDEMNARFRQMDAKFDQMNEKLDQILREQRQQ